MSSFVESRLLLSKAIVLDEEPASQLENGNQLVISEYCDAVYARCFSYPINICRYCLGIYICSNLRQISKINIRSLFSLQQSTVVAQSYKSICCLNHFTFILPLNHPQHPISSEQSQIYFIRFNNTRAQLLKKKKVRQKQLFSPSCRT